MKYNKLQFNKKGAFSLVEVLISLVLISLVMVATAPIITKKITEKTNNGIVYTYNPNNNAKENNLCYITNITNYSSNTESYTSTTKCSEYQFKVPDGVHKINVTLVAGGGGGGGAAGGKIQVNSISTQGPLVNHININGFQPDLLKEVLIKTLVAKGQTGGNKNESCKSEESKCGGRGGDSSMAIMNFKIPENYMRGFNFTSGLQTSTNLNGKLSIEANTNPYVKIITATNSTFNDSNKIQYGINYTSSGYNAYCDLGAARNTISSSGSSKCGIYPPFVQDSVKGEYGRGENDQKTIFADSSGAIFAGGQGGMIKGASTYGSGGTGGYLKLVCPDSPSHLCLVKNALEVSADKSPTQGGGAYVAVDYTIEYPAGAGGGGAGGSSARIIGLDVIPNETYTIRVGSGGQGGTASVSSTAPKAGANGVGGTTSAIYDSNDNLIYMVTGGAGGEGGKVYAAGSYAGQIGKSGRFAPKIISGDANLISNIKLDNKVNENIAGNIGTIPTKAGNSAALSSVNITYPYNQAEPFLTLNSRIDENTDTSDSRSGGFSGYDITSQKSSNITYNGSNISTAYDGLYFRNLLNNKPYYIGGLGGFSGVSQKAGCGGYFMGNFDGRTSFAENSNLINKFVIDNNLYSISKYYTNCNMNSPNGQSAEFIPPIPNSSNLGSAGSGGGGGGYNIQAGSGNGGDGQDGYVMIEWRK